MSRRIASGTTDRIELPSISPGVPFSIAFWAKAINQGALNRYYFSLGADIVSLYVPSGTSDFRFNRDYATTDGQWTCTSANHGMTLSAWNHIAVTFDGSTATSAVKFYANGVSKTVTQTQAPIGARNGASGVLMIGNLVGNANPIGSSIANFSVHPNVLLTDGEISDLMVGNFAPRGVIAFLPLWGDAVEPDLSGNLSNGTVFGTTITDHPPVRSFLFSEPRVFVPTPAPPSATIEDFWRAGMVGNGRVWISGTVRVGSNVGTRWRVNSSNWIVGDSGKAAGERIGFYVTGDDRSEWGTLDIKAGAWDKPVGTYYTNTSVDRQPTFFYHNGVRIEAGTQLADLTFGVARWFWNPTNSTLYFRTVDDSTPFDSYAIIDPVFHKGNTYHLEVQLVDNVNPPVTLIDETFIWACTVRNSVDRFLKIILPKILEEDDLGKTLYYVYAKQCADLEAMLEDVSGQLLLDTASWSLGLWEDQLGIPFIDGLNVEQRRSFIHSVRKVTTTKEEFFQEILNLAPGISVIETYEDLRVDIRLSGDPSPSLRRALAQIIARKKPGGIQVVVSYSSFLAGISEAGDPL